MNLTELKKQKQDKVNTLMTDCKIFFAFSNQQFAENKTELQEGEKYVSIGGGGYMPKSQYQKFSDGMKAITKWFKETVKNDKLRIENIKYELHNHECFYTGEIDTAVEALGSDYTFTEVNEVFQKERKNVEVY